MIGLTYSIVHLRCCTVSMSKSEEKIVENKGHAFIPYAQDTVATKVRLFGNRLRTSSNKKILCLDTSIWSDEDHVVQILALKISVTYFYVRAISIFSNTRKN